MTSRKTPATIAVFRALQLGDMLCAVPALRALRATFPAAHIDLVGLPWAAEFAERFERYLDGFIEFPGYPELPERAPDVAGYDWFIRDMRAREYDLAIQMHGDGRVTNGIVATFEARQTAGFVARGARPPGPGAWVEYPDGIPEVARHLWLAAALGATDSSWRMEFPLGPADMRAFRALAEATGLGGRPYVCLHAGGRNPARRWPVRNFARVADGLAALGYTIVLTGTRDESTLAACLRAAMHAPAFDLTGRTNLGTLGVLVRGARLVVCNDTGISHIASAVSTPSVVISTNSDPVRWSPLDGDRHRVLVSSSPVSPTPDEVLDEVAALPLEVAA